MTISLSNLEIMRGLIESVPTQSVNDADLILRIQQLIEAFLNGVVEESNRGLIRCPVCIQEVAAHKVLFELWVNESGAPEECPFVLNPMRFCDQTWAERSA